MGAGEERFRRVWTLEATLVRATGCPSAFPPGPRLQGERGKWGLSWSLGPWICINHFYIKIFPGCAQWALTPPAQGQQGCAWGGGGGLQEVLQHQPSPPVPFLEECYHCRFLERT